MSNSKQILFQNMEVIQLLIQSHTTAIVGVIIYVQKVVFDYFLLALNVIKMNLMTPAMNNEKHHVYLSPAMWCAYYCWWYVMKTYFLDHMILIYIYLWLLYSPHYQQTWYFILWYLCSETKNNTNLAYMSTWNTIYYLYPKAVIWTSILSPLVLLMMKYIQQNL